MSKHTLGPWKWDGNVCDYDPSNEAPWIIAGDLDEIAVLTGEIKCTNPANAKLIIAAPELFEALKKCLEHGIFPTAAISDAVDKAKAAIAKATGEQA
jgi:hypothetical protein